MMKSTKPVEAIVSVAKSLTTLHWAAVGRRVAPQCNDRRRRTRADWRCLIGVAVSAALSLGVAGAAWAVLPDELKPVTKPEPKTTASSKPAVGSEPKPQAKSRSEAETPRATSSVMKPGEVFRDCSDCPEMVVIPAGRFVMGSPKGESGRSNGEGPQHKVTMAQPFAVGKYEVSFAEWDACVAARGCRHRPDDQGWGRRRRPVVNVSWEDAQTYVAWLANKTGKGYRMLSETEWEYAARAGTTSAYPWGKEPGKGRANFSGSGSQWSGKQTAPVGSFAPNGFGLYDMIGNALEWTEDCWNDGYLGAPTDGSPWLKGDCGRRVVRGGSWGGFPGLARAAYSLGYEPGVRFDNLGFRLARTL